MLATTDARPSGLRTRALGKSGLVVSEIGFGAWGIGGKTPGTTSYGATDDRRSLRALGRALDRGITLYDTAPAYGAGHSETLIGQAIQGRTRQNVIIATKGGCEDFDRPLDFSLAALEKGLTDSLKRLRTDWVDLFQLHNPPPDRMERGEDLRRLVEDWREAGRIRAFGVSVSQPGDGLIALKHLAPDALQTNFNLVDQRCDHLGLLEAARETDCALIARTPLCFGFLSGALESLAIFPDGDHRARWPDDLKRAWVEEGRRMVEAVRVRTKGTAAQIALRFCLWPEAMACAIPGMLSPEEVEENADAVSLLPPLPADAVARLRSMYDGGAFTISNGPRQGLRR